MLRKAAASGDEGTIGLLHCTTAAGYWTQERRHRYGLTPTPLCPRCGTAPEPPSHRYWNCPANDLLQEDCMQKSEPLRRQALAEANTYQCFWLRGLPPASWTANLQPAIPTEHIEYSTGRGAWTPEFTYYVDGSGGTHSSDKRIRRCGVGIVQLDYRTHSDYTLTEGLYGPLPGIKQTSGRAELYALAILLRKALYGHIKIICDCSPVVRGSSARGPRRQRRLYGPNADLCESVYRSIDERNDPINIIWHQALAEAELLWCGAIAPEAYIGNSFADEYAKSGVATIEVDFSSVATVARLDKKTSIILQRITTVLKQIEDAQPFKDSEAQAAHDERVSADRRKRAARRRRRRDAPLSSLAASRGHVLKRQGRTLFCAMRHQKG